MIRDAATERGRVLTPACWDRRAWEFWLPRSVDALIAAADDPDPIVRRAVAMGLAWTREERALTKLIELLATDTDPDVRGFAATEMLETEHPRALRALARGLVSDLYLLAFFAANDVLGRLRHRGLAEALARETLAADGPARAFGAGLLGEIRDPVGVPALIEVARDEEESPAVSAVDALGRIGDPQAADVLIAALESPHPRVRYRAAEALGWIGDRRALEPLLARWSDDAAGGLVAVYARAAAQMIRDRVRGGREPRRAASRIADALPPYPVHRSDLEWLLERLAGDDDEDRRGAARDLARLGDARAMPALVRTLSDPVGKVRQAAAEALGFVGDPAAIEALLPVLRDSDGVARWLAAEALARLAGTEHRARLLRAEREGDADVRLGVALALTLQGSLRGLRRAVSSLGRTGDGSKRRLVAALTLGRVYRQVA